MMQESAAPVGQDRLQHCEKKKKKIFRGWVGVEDA